MKIAKDDCTMAQRERPIGASTIATEQANLQFTRQPAVANEYRCSGSNSSWIVGDPVIGHALGRQGSAL
jgi:hypothetical protein